MNTTLRDSVIVTLYWIAVLTPFMLLPNPSWLVVPVFVGMDPQQYFSWLLVEILIVPPLGLGSVRLVRWIEERSRRMRDEQDYEGFLCNPDYPEY